MIALDAHDYPVIHAALDLLGRYTDNELARARLKGNNAKQVALQNMRQQVATVRAKIHAMQVQS